MTDLERRFQLENAAKARKWFERMDQRLPRGVHLTINGRSSCQVRDVGPCQFDSSQQAATEAVKIRLEFRERVQNLDVRLQPGKCPVCRGERK